MPVAGYQSWRNLLFLHWPVPADQLRPRVPAQLQIDEFEGTAYIGLVPFVVHALRPIGFPPKLGLRFLETNVRTYVHVNGRDHGVYFFSLDAASLLAVIGARVGTGLPYVWARGGIRISESIDYHLQRRSGRGCSVHYTVGSPLGTAMRGTLEYFLVERYILHVRRGPSLWSIRVAHQPYALHSVELHSLDEQLVSTTGITTSSTPLAHYSPGVDVATYLPSIQLTRVVE
jgi:uncharacterized protein YqjF (DUF2071 family)